MKVAFTSSAGAIIDGNFCKSKSFSVWDIGPHEAFYVTTVNIKADAGNEDDRMAARAEALKECAIGLCDADQRARGSQAGCP